MFKITKEELAETSEKLNETSEKYQETAVKLSDTTNALAHTQKVLFLLLFICFAKSVLIFTANVSNVQFYV